MNRIKTIIADGNALSRAGLRSFYQEADKIELVGEVSNSNELLALLKKSKIQVVVIDFTSNGFNINLLQRLSSKYPNLKFVAITHEQSAHTIINALKAGVQSYVKKDCDEQEILDAVIETGKGGSFFCGQILDVIKRSSINTEKLKLDNLSCDPILLSNREVEIIKHIAEGYTNTEIAEKLFLSGHTVNTHRRNIMAKLGVNNTAGMVMYAVREGIVSPNKFLFSRS